MTEQHSQPDDVKAEDQESRLDAGLQAAFGPVLAIADARDGPSVLAEIEGRSRCTETRVFLRGEAEPGDKPRGPSAPQKEPSQRRPLRDAGRDRPRGDGCHHPQPRQRPRPRCGDEGPPVAARRQRGDGAAVRRGSPDRRTASAPGSPDRLRAGPSAGPAALLHDEAHQGPDPGGASGRAQRSGPGPPPVPEHLRAHVPDHRLRACARRDPPGPQAGQRHGRQLRRGPGRGLGSGQGAAA